MAHALVLQQVVWTEGVDAHGSLHGLQRLFRLAGIDQRGGVLAEDIGIAGAEFHGAGVVVPRPLIVSFGHGNAAHDSMGLMVVGVEFQRLGGRRSAIVQPVLTKRT